MPCPVILWYEARKMDHEPSFPARSSIRLRGFDYSQAGVYFVTVCTHDRGCLFGEIRHGTMQLNEAGSIVRQCWLETPRHFPGVELQAYVVMPNHIHGVVAIFRRARHAVPLRDTKSKVEAFGKPIAGSLPTIIRSFKAAVSKRVRAMRRLPTTQIWQRNYYERVIRTGDEFDEVSRYIWENPKAWEFDEENPNRRDR